MMDHSIQQILERVSNGELSDAEAEKQYLELITNSKAEIAESPTSIVEKLVSGQKNEFKSTYQDSYTFTQRTIEQIKAVENPEYRLFVFLPFGFGNETVSWSWKNSFEENDNVDIWLIGASDIDDWQILVNRLVESMLPLCDIPFIVYGHSMGGIVAYEILIELEHQYQLSPIVFIPSSVAPPEIFQRIKTLPPIYDINDEMEMQDCRNLLEKSQIILPLKSGVKALTDKAIQCDIALLKTYSSHHAETPLSCAVMALQANNDILVKDSITVTLWKNYTKGYFFFQEVEGTHLYFINPPLSFFKILKSFLQKKEDFKLCTIKPKAYQLLSFETGTEEVHVYPYSVKPKGYLIYQADGKMAAHLWNPSRKSHEMASEVEKIFTYLSYSGDYQVKQGMIEHTVLVSTDPNFVDDNLIRYYQIDGKFITLLTAPLTTQNNKQSKCSSYSKLVWQEVEDKVKYSGHPLIGSWILNSYQDNNEDVLGVDPEGVLILTSQGYFSIVAMRQKRSRPYYDNLLLASEQEIVDAIESSISYCGRFKITDNNNITFFIEESLLEVSTHQQLMQYKLTDLGLELKRSFKQLETNEFHCITGAWAKS